MNEEDETTMPQYGEHGTCLMEATANLWAVLHDLEIGFAEWLGEERQGDIAVECSGNAIMDATRNIILISKRLGELHENLREQVYKPSRG